MPRLLLLDAEYRGQALVFASGAVLGRGQFADLRVEHPTVSRRHARFDVRADGVWLHDLGSVNGTRRNGAPVGEQPQQLRDGDELQFGQLRARFETSGSEHIARPSEEGAAEPTRRALDAQLNLLTEMARLSSSQDDVDAQVETFLDLLLGSFPRIDTAAILLYIPAADAFAVFRLRGGEADEAVLIEIARRSLGHQRGLFCVEGTAAATATPSVAISLAALRQMTAAPGRLPLPPTLACMPLRFGAERLGALLLSSRQPAALRLGDRELLGAAAGILSWLLAAQAQAGPDLKVSASDLGLARRIQQRFLPQDLPRLPGYRFADSYTSARAIGGDHYDYLRWPDGRLCIVVSDVSGKALSGALYVARFGAELRHLAEQHHQPGALLEAINARMHPQMEAGMFVTVAALGLDPASGTLELALAGHPPPLLRRRDGRVEPLAGRRGPPIGAAAGLRYPQTRHLLEPGELLLLYTDGLDEAQNRERQMFGLERIGACLAGAEDPAAAVAALRAALGQFVGSQPQADDLTLVCMGRERG